MAVLINGFDQSRCGVSPEGQGLRHHSKECEDAGCDSHFTDTRFQNGKCLLNQLLLVADLLAHVSSK